MSDQVPIETVQRRIRNHIIRYFEMASSANALLEYQRNVPIAYVYAELFEQWHDWGEIQISSIGKKFPDPIYSDEERVAIANYEQMWQETIKRTPKHSNIASFVRTTEYEKLASVAKESLAVFQKRGFLPDD
jgi:hypothetical protein